jgi:O-acetyl-ADP-ribose deacetylase (regulator of RNase III)
VRLARTALASAPGVRYGQAAPREGKRMADLKGEVIETPTQDLPFKAVISADGKILRETYLASRPMAEAFIVNTIKGLAETEKAGDLAPGGGATGAVVETPTQDLPFKAVISTEGKIIQERFFATRAEAEAFIVDTLKESTKSGANEGRIG